MIKKRKYLGHCPKKAIPYQIIHPFLNFRMIWKMLTPISDIHIFEFENILTAEDPLGQTYQKGYLEYPRIENGQIKRFSFSFLDDVPP